MMCVRAGHRRQVRQKFARHLAIGPLRAVFIDDIEQHEFEFIPGLRGMKILPCSKTRAQALTNI
jgi:hypothetical protein